MRHVTINGKKFEVANEPADYWGWVNEGRYNREWAAYDRYLKPEHTFIDLGAWVGSHSLYASRIAKRIVSVEPDPIAYKIMVENLSLCPRPATHVDNRAITDKEGWITIGSGFLGASTTRINPAAGGGIGPWEDGHVRVVASTTLRKLCEGIKDPLFIKMDVEGAEELILSDVAFFEDRKPTLLVELHPWWWITPSRQFFDKIKSLYSNAVNVDGDTWLLQ